MAQDIAWRQLCYDKTSKILDIVPTMGLADLAVMKELLANAYADGYTDGQWSMTRKKPSR